MSPKAWLLAALIVLAMNGTAVYTVQASEAVTANPEHNEISVYEAEQAELQKQAKITKAQSIEIAQKQVNGTVQDVELGTEDGTVVYNVLIEDAKEQFMEVKVDAVTGSIIEVEESNELLAEDIE